MNNASLLSSRSVITMRRLARIFGILSMSVLLFFFVADCIEKGRIAIENERVPMTVFLLLTFIGLIIAWKWEGIGGATALVGLIGFNILAPVSVTRAGIFVITGLYGLPALLFLFCWRQTKKQINPKDT